MLPTYLYSIGSVVIVSLISLVGVFTLSLQEARLKKYIFLLVSLAVGALLGDALIHLIPEALKTISDPTRVSLAVIAGILIFFILEKFLHWHHHARGEDSRETIHPTGQMILISDGLHNFIDGLIIGASYLVGREVGLATTLAVILHEIPQEIGDFGVLLHSGYSRRRALWLNFLSGLAAGLGVILALLLGVAGESLTIWLIPLAAGGFIYTALSDLVPELHKNESPQSAVWQFVAVSFGVMAMLLLLAIE